MFRKTMLGLPCASAFWLRHLKMEDAEAACAVHSEAVLGIAPEPYSPEMIQAWLDSLDPERMREHLRKPGLQAWAVEQQGRMRAFLLVDGNRLWALYVHGSCQGQGLGRELVQVASRCAKQQGHALLQLRSALPVVGFYKRCGFVEAERDCVIMGDGLVMECLRMEKLLRDV